MSDKIIGAEELTTNSGETIIADGARNKDVKTQSKVVKERVLDKNLIKTQYFSAPTGSQLMMEVREWLENNATIKIISTNTFFDGSESYFTILYRG